ncbi:MAG: hypothetical protein IPO21_01800 [Bacteroidales bacterium]|nr:hypothetical protein [Bacteroidales bacterium]
MEKSIKSLEARITILEKSAGDTSVNVIDTSKNIIEEFTEDDKPQNINFIINSETFYFSSPWGYNKPENKDRKYPIVVFGKHDESVSFTDTIRKKYPAFYFIYLKATEADGVALENLISNVIIKEKGYRIDTNRMYLTGFSEGGSGGYKLLQGLYTKGMFFAGMIRIAGQSQTSLNNEIVAKTSIWYHIGLSDSDVRVQTADNAYLFMKNNSYNSLANEVIANDTVTSTVNNIVIDFPRTTKTLVNNNVEVFKLSSYKTMGHITSPAYSDPTIFDWLFSQNLLNK